MIYNISVDQPVRHTEIRVIIRKRSTNASKPSAPPRAPSARNHEKKERFGGKGGISIAVE